METNFDTPVSVDTAKMNPFEGREGDDLPVDKIEDKTPDPVKVEGAEVAAKTEAAPVDTTIVVPPPDTTLVDERDTEITRLRGEVEQYKTKGADPITFANEESKKAFDLLREGKLDDLYKVLDKKQKLSRTDQMNAAEAIQTHLLLSKPHYTADDVRDIFEDNYQKPTEPAQREDELDAEYDTRVARWKETCAKVDRRIERDSREAKEALRQMNQDLVLPDIKRADPEAENASREEAARIEELRGKYLQTLNSDYQKVKGITAEYKDQEITIPVSFDLTPQMQEELKQKMQSFDVNELAASRWLKPDGSFDVPKQIEDYLWWTQRDQMVKKLVTDAVEKWKANYFKGKSNIDLRTQTSGPAGTASFEKDHLKAQMDHIWNNA